MNYGPPQGQMPQPQKQGMSTLSIVLIIFGVIGLLALGTCGVGALWLGHEVKEVQKNLLEGGLVLIAPPEVTQALAGPKKDYVGSWKSKSGKSTMVVDSSGNLNIDLAESGAHEKVEAPIASFIGDDMDIKMGIEMRIKVTETPHKVGDQWQMKAKDIAWQR